AQVVAVPRGQPLVVRRRLEEHTTDSRNARHRCLLIRSAVPLVPDRRGGEGRNRLLQVSQLWVALGSERMCVRYRSLGLRILFATEGITIHPIARRPIQLSRSSRVAARRIQWSWSEIDFVNAIPAAEQIDGAWRFKDLRMAPGWDIL